MIGNVQVEVDQRSDTGKNHCRRLRRAGKVPAVVYGLGRPPFPVAVEARKVEEVLRLESGRNTIFSLALSGESDRKRAVMIREIQRDPLTERMLHLDFVRVDLEKPVTVSVPVHLVGTPEGVKNEGGVVDFVHRTVEVECLPANIPDRIDVDISALHINQNISVAEISEDAAYSILDPAETILAVVVPPRVEAEPTTAEEEAEAAEAAAGAEAPAEGKEGESAKGEESAS
jgi:large subunit ribosomal protein L25